MTKIAAQFRVSISAIVSRNHITNPNRLGEGQVLVIPPAPPDPGPRPGDAPLRYRRTVLEPGGSVSANDLVKNFLGRPQSMGALQRWMAAEFNPTP